MATAEINIPTESIRKLVAESIRDREQMLLTLISDMYDPNDCNLVSNGPGSAPTCVEHNYWDPDEPPNGGRGCPHARARRLLAALEAGS
jgi:hypothetical protein